MPKSYRVFRALAGPLLVSLLLVGSAQAQSLLMPFRDVTSGYWGYKESSGRIVIAPHYRGAGAFVKGKAVVEEDDHFAVLDMQGRVVERIETASVAGNGGIIPAPNQQCAWSGGARFPAVPPSSGLDCYFNQLRGTAEASGGELAEQTEPGEGYRKFLVFKLRSGVVLIHNMGYEGSRKRLLLPGVSHEQAKIWQQILYPDGPAGDGCAEWWDSGEINGGAYIEQAQGC